MKSWVVRGGTLVTLDPLHEVVQGDLLITDGRIAALGALPWDRLPPGTQVLNAQGCLVMPGLVQGHVHLCQTLCRGQADDLDLLSWLRERVWPYEGALSEEAAACAAQLGCAELLLSGTTALLDMGTVHHEDALISAVARTGIRATVGKAMMDAGDDVPASLRETTADSLRESDRICGRWHGQEDGRIRYAYAPRFILSCSDPLLRGVAERVAAAGPDGPLIHTHAAEQLSELFLVRQRLGRDNVAALLDLGIAGPKVVLAHCVHVDEQEQELLRRHRTHVAHCPSSNLKLGSGIAQVAEMLAAGINVALGADGAPCNNRLDAFAEMRLGALLQKGRLGPRAISARQALEMATLHGARALGLESEIGSLSIGKRADVVVVDARTPHATPEHDPYSTLVYAASGGDVRHVLVDGRLLVRDRELTPLTGIELPALLTAATEQARLTRRRAGLS